MIKLYLISVFFKFFSNVNKKSYDFIKFISKFSLQKTDVKKSWGAIKLLLKSQICLYYKYIKQQKPFLEIANASFYRGAFKSFPNTLITCKS